MKDRVAHSRGGEVEHNGDARCTKDAMEGSQVGLPRRDDHDQGGGQTKDQSGNDELGDDSEPQAAYLRRAVLDRS